MDCGYTRMGGGNLMDGWMDGRSDGLGWYGMNEFGMNFVCCVI